jgi:hypothetical protein
MSTGQPKNKGKEIRVCSRGCAGVRVRDCSVKDRGCPLPYSAIRV